MRYGLLGAGMMGQEHLRNISLLGKGEVTAICEPDAGMRQRSAEFAPAATFVDDIGTLLDSDVDALVIATPNYQHADQLLDIMAQRTLPILVEKPLVTTPEDVLRLRDAAAGYDAPIWVGMEYRYMPPMTVYADKLAEGVTGQRSILSIREHRYPFLKKVGNWNRFNRNSGGTLVEKCCHFFDLMRYLLQAEPVRVTASAGQSHNHKNESYEGETPDIWDNGFVIVDFDNGSRGLLDLCMFAEGSRFEQEISVAGERGKAEVFIPGPRALWKENQAEPKVVISPRHPVGTTEIPVPVDAEVAAAGSHTGATFYQHEGFAEIAVNGGKPGVSVEDGLKAVVMGMAAQVAAIEGRVVNIVEGGYAYE